MASFSFDVGNAQTLVRLPLYGLGRIATLVIPRERGAWVFGSGAGIGDGALALWDHAAAEGHRAVWLAGSDRERTDAAARGIPTVHRGSARGFWLTARASVIVVTHGFGDVNRYGVSGALIVQLWHGIPLKRLGLDSPATFRLPGPWRSGRIRGGRILRRLLAIGYRRAQHRIGVLPAASQLVRGRLESAFGLPDGRVPVTGEPRVDVLCRGTAAGRRRAAEAALTAAAGAVPAGARRVLYAPTWRDGAADPAVPSSAQWRGILDVLERNDAVLYVRSHPLGAGDYRPPVETDRVRDLGSDVLTDVTPALPGFDALITDYSSIAFDAALVPVPIVFLAPDVAGYAAERGFYGDYEDVAGADWATHWDAAAHDLGRLLADPAERAQRLARAERLSAGVHAFRDGGNTARVYRAILASSRGRAEAEGI